MQVIWLMCIALGVVLLFMTALWFVYMKKGNAGIVDMGWALSFLLAYGVAVIGGKAPNKTILLGFIIIPWSLRLFYHLWNRFDSRVEDPRYANLRKKWGGDKSGMKFLLMYWFQGLLVIAISFPFLLVATDPYHPINNWEFAGLIIAVAAMFGEAVADAQLACFKSRNQDKGKICKIGLWSVSRHPNYFFEWLVWVGVFVFALGSPYGIYAIISPLLMYYLLVYVSGIPPLEKQMKSSKKEAYEEYVEMVPAFFPKIRLNEL